MQIRICSDLHLEFFKPNSINVEDIIPRDDRDIKSVLVLAGDIVLATKIFDYSDFFENICDRFMSVIYIFGNHEYYRNSIDGTHENVRSFRKALDLKNLYILQNEHVNIGGVYFAGTTLWTDMDGASEYCMREATRCMPENRGLVKWSPEQDLKPIHTIDFHKESLQFLDKFSSDIPKDAIRIMIGHHLPSYQSIDPIYKKSTLNGAFASELCDNIKEWKPNLFIHGHTHEPCDYKIGNTRILCNPLGYPNHGNEGKNFNKCLFVEV